MALRARYTGDGTAYLNGIPARNLDEDEFEALSADDRRRVRASGLYDVRTDAEMHPAAKSEPPRKAG